MTSYMAFIHKGGMIRERGERGGVKKRRLPGLLFDRDYGIVLVRKTEDRGPGFGFRQNRLFERNRQ